MIVNIFKNKKTSNHGFSLIELLIVIGLLGGLSVFIMSITKQSAKSTAKLEFDTDTILTTNEINGILSDEVKCIATFGLTNTPASINSKYYTTASGLSPASGYGNSGLMISSYTLTGTSPNSILTIVYENKKILQGQTGPTSLSKKIDIYSEYVAGVMTKCRSLSSSTTDIWSHGAGYDIYYKNGRVGIGTTAPVSSLEISGGVKIGNPGNSCNSQLEGTLRYNKASHQMEYCGLSGWKTMNGGYPHSSLDTGFIQFFPIIPGNGITYDSSQHGFVIDLDHFTNTLSHNASSYIVQVGFKQGGAYPMENSLYLGSSTGAIDVGLRSYTGSTLLIDQYDGTPTSGGSYVRVRIWE